MNKLLPLLLLAAMCGGCETVVFEQPPVAAQACDPALVGRWASIGDKPADRGEVELRIAPDCALLFVEHEKGGTREGDPTPLHVGRDGRLAYAWVDARWAERRMAISGDPPATPAAAPSTPDFAEGDVVVYRYRIAGRRLVLMGTDPKRFAHRIIDGKLKGAVPRTTEGDLAVRVAAGADPRALRDATLFPPGDVAFERAPTDE